MLSLYTLVHAFAFVYTRACVRPCLCAPVPVYARGCVHPYLGASAPEWVRVQSPSVCMARVHFVYTSYKHLWWMRWQPRAHSAVTLPLLISIASKSHACGSFTCAVSHVRLPCASHTCVWYKPLQASPDRSCYNLVLHVSRQTCVTKPRCTNTLNTGVKRSHYILWFLVT